MRAAFHRDDVSPQYPLDQIGTRRATGRGQEASPVCRHAIGEHFGLRREHDPLLRQAAQERLGRHLQVDRWVLRAWTATDVRDVQCAGMLQPQRPGQCDRCRCHGDRDVAEVGFALAQLRQRKGARTLNHRAAPAQLCDPQDLAGHQFIAEAGRNHRIEAGGQRRVHQLHGHGRQRRKQCVVAEDGDREGGSAQARRAVRVRQTDYG